MQIGRCHQSSQYNFVANCSAGVKKDLNHHKQENNKNGCVVKFTER